jgi:S1-C subfamily serine protease
LHSIPWGNSDDIKVGEWVLAVGNPFNLTSTVTAGIVSAKGRNINIIDKKMAIESFIQTDAAVNPGNSGGALVNVNGELVGINSAIASRTGSFSGYSFAVPSGIVKKVVGDIIEYGNVQRAVLGVAISTMSSELAEQFKLDMKAGVLITDLNVGGSAAQAGLRTNDIISKIEGVAVTKSSELQEQIGRHRPGDKVRIEYIRNGTVAMATVTLQNTNGNTAIVKADSMEALGATLASVPTKEKSRLGITHGMQITGLKTGKLMRSGIQEGFVIVKMNNTFIDTIKDIQDAIAVADKGVMVSGIYPNGAVAYYAFGLD